MIYIIGAGAIGQALAVCLKNVLKEVTLIRGSVDDQPETIQSIRLQLPSGNELSADVPVKTLSQFSELDGPVLVTTKSYGNEAIAAKLAGLDRVGAIVLLQNGLNIERPFLAHRFPALYRCVLMVTSQFTTDDALSFKPVNACPLGLVLGKADELLPLVTQLDNSWFRFKAEADIQPLIWKKAIINCVFNSICPLLETDNGIFQRDPATLEVARRVIAECIRVAECQEIALTADEVEETLLAISRSSDGQLISTLQDIRNHRPTEISTLNQEIVQMAEAGGLAALVAETRLLGELTTIKSQLNR
ncbi:ketopantoate reductase family protein [Mucilaginibacter sp. HD30]